MENGKDLGLRKKIAASHKYNVLNEVVRTEAKSYVIENTYNAEGLKTDKKVDKYDTKGTLKNTIM